LQAGGDESVQVAIEDLLRVRDFHPGAQVLDAALVQHVGADLVAPAHIALRVLELLLFGHALAHLELIQARLQHLHGFRAVAVLRTVVLALHHDSGRDVRDAYGRIGLVDVLAAGTAGAVRIDAQISRVDFDFEGVVDFRVHKYAGKRGVPAIGGVEGTLAYQAVHAGFSAQQAIGIFALEFDRRGFDAGDFAFGDFQYLGLEFLAFPVVQVLAQQHRGPVLGFRAAGTRLDV